MQGVTFSRIGAVMHHLANPVLAHELAADRRAAATAARTARTSRRRAHPRPAVLAFLTRAVR